MTDDLEILSKIAEDLQKRFNLSASAIKDIFSRAVVNNISKGETICKQGVTSPFLYFIVEGRAEVVRDGLKIAEVKQGDIVGEMSILGKGKATATVNSLTVLVVFKFLKEKFNIVLNKYPSLNKAVVMEAINRKNEQNDVEFFL
ncbi:MAG: cyclic nucleotide-binding domain-containing protein [Candidatus Margulisbacteria bacterium]|nr:cyclic nucleotide-binding domain-containing protein [Candidatus Margulisiibacteriota bacterium]